MDQGRVVERTKAPGSGLEPRPRRNRAVAEPVGPASAVVNTPRKPLKGPSKRARAAKGTPTTDPNERSIGERIEALREEAKLLALYLQESDDEFEDEDDEDREADIDIAIGLMEVLEQVEDPSPEVAALVVVYRPRPDWDDL